MRNITSCFLLLLWGYVGYTLMVAIAWAVVLFGMDQWQWLLLLIPIAGAIVVYPLFHDRVDQWLRKRSDRTGGETRQPARTTRTCRNPLRGTATCLGNPPILSGARP